MNKLRARTPVGWLQLRHERTRLVVAISGIVFADILMFMQLGLLSALFDTSITVQKQLRADIVLISPQARDLVNSGTIPRSRLYESFQVPGVRSAKPLYVSYLDWANPGNGEKQNTMVIGMDPTDSALSMPAVLDQVAALKRLDTVLFDRTTRGDYRHLIEGIEQGLPVTAEIQRRRITIVGLFTLGASFGTDGAVVTSDQTFLHLFPSRNPGAITLGLLQVEPGADPNRVAAELNNRLPADVRALTRDGFIRFAINYQAQRVPIGFIFGIGTVMGFIVGLVMVYQILSTDVNDHLAEYATFIAMGYTHKYLLTVILEESLILAGLGFAPGLTAAVGLYGLIHYVTALPISMPPSRVAAVFATTLIMCVLSGGIAARKLRKADPAEIFA